MKKVLLITVALLLVAGIAYAGTVVGGKHDLSTGGGAAVKSSNIAEVCVFCHTPHAATAVGDAPLWNRNAQVISWTYYSTTTLNDTTPTLGNMSTICLSCHDGNVGAETLVNGSGSGSAGSPTLAWSASVWTGITNLNDSASLANDHPVGVSVVGSSDSNINQSPNTLVKLYSSVVECASCHNVHDYTNVPFLRASNSASQMCMACHNK